MKQPQPHHTMLLRLLKQQQMGCRCSCPEDRAIFKKTSDAAAVMSPCHAHAAGCLAPCDADPAGLQESVKQAGIPPELRQAREAILSLEAPDELQEDVAQAAGESTVCGDPFCRVHWYLCYDKHPKVPVATLAAAKSRKWGWSGSMPDVKGIDGCRWRHQQLLAGPVMAAAAYQGCQSLPCWQVPQSMQATGHTLLVFKSTWLQRQRKRWREACWQGAPRTHPQALSVKLAHFAP